jgi:hypothetical protein
MVVNTQNILRRGITDGSVDNSIVGVLNINNILIPGPWMLLIISSQIMNQCLVYQLFLPIHLGLKVIDLFNLVSMFTYKEVLDKSILIRDDTPWHPKVCPNPFKEKDYCFLSFVGFLTSHMNAPLTKLVNYHIQVIMPSSCPRQAPNKLQNSMYILFHGLLGTYTPPLSIHL